MGKRRRRWAVVLVLALLVLGGFAAGIAAYMFPHDDEPRQADAIIVLGGLRGKPVISEALRLAGKGYSSHIVISDSFGGDTRAKNLCSKPSGYDIECFQPTPGTTQGEARMIERFAAERGWQRVIVVTTTYHQSRARLLVERCYSGELEMIGVDVPMDAGDWAYQYAYQTAGFAKAWLSPSC